MSDWEQVCAHCGVNVRTVNYALGQKLMHVAPGDRFGSEYECCRRTVASLLTASTGPAADTVGRCGTASPAIAGAVPAICALPAGHSGWHREGVAEWGSAQPTGLAPDLLHDPCGEEVAAPNYHFAETHGDWLPCTLRRGHDGDHEHEPSGYSWELFPRGNVPATGEWPIRQAAAPPPNSDGREATA